MNTDFTDRLHTAMTQLPAPVPPDLVRRVNRRYNRRRATTWAAATGTAAVAGLAVILAIPGTPAARPVADKTTAYVVSRVTSALESVSPHAILFEKTTHLHPGSGEGPEYSWSTFYQTRSMTFTSTGQLRSDESLDQTATTLTHLIVDYQAKTWEQIVLPPESAPPPAPAPSCASGAPQGWYPDPADEAALLRTAVACGELKASDGGMIDGVSTIKLSEPPGTTSMTFWVDATTYLPVRTVQVWAHEPYSEADVQMDMQWLPPTPANKAKLTVPIPAGFRHAPWS